MTRFFLQITGWLFAHAPEPLLHFTAWILGPVILLIPRRRLIIYSNLHHAFPKKPRSWHVRIARKSCRRLIETSLLSIAAPYLSDKRLRTIASFSPSMHTAAARRIAEGDNPAPAIVGTMHFAYWESLTWLSLFTDYRCEVGVVFRPLKNQKLNEWIKRTRERHGMKLFSRRDGLMEVFRVLRRHGIISILFDQNAGGPGALTTLLGRICSTSEFPGTLVEKYHARLTVLYPRRLGFWRIRYEIEDIPNDGTAQSATINLNHWLENTLATDETLCASWLWSHARWKSQNWPEERFRFVARHDFLEADLAAHGWTRDTMPRKTRLWLRMPDDSSHHVHIAPLLRALRQSRPDIELTLFASETWLSAFEPLRADNTVDFIHALPPPGFASRCYFRKLRREYPDVFVNLSESSASDREAKLTHAPQRFGITYPGHRRSLLTHCYEAPANALPPAELYRNFFIHFGLPEKEKPKGNNIER